MIRFSRCHVEKVIYTVDKVIRLRLEQLLLVDMVTMITRQEFQSS